MYHTYAGNVKFSSIPLKLCRSAQALACAVEFLKRYLEVVLAQKYYI